MSTEAATVLKILTPNAGTNSWLVVVSGNRYLLVEMEDRETRALAAVRLDRDAAIGLLSQLHSLCKKAGWLKE